MVKNCDISNDILTYALQSPKILSKISADVLFLSDIDSMIAKWIGNVNNNIAMKLGVESNIYYTTIGSYINNVLENKWFSKQIKMKKINDMISSLLPNGKGVVSAMSKIDEYKKLFNKNIDNRKISNIISFDIALAHKHNNFKYVKWENDGYKIYQSYGVWETWYELYVDILKWVTENKSITNKWIDDILESINTYKQKKTHWQKVELLDWIENLYHIIDNAGSMKELEETFMLLLPYFDGKAVEKFLNKIDDFRVGWDKFIKTFWQWLSESKINPWKIIRWYNLEQIKKRLIINNSFEFNSIKDDDLIKFVDNVADLVSWKVDSITIWKKEFTAENSRLLVDIIWFDNLEYAYSKKWLLSIHYKQLEDLRNMDDIIDTAWRVNIEYKYNKPEHINARKFDNEEDYYQSMLSKDVIEQSTIWETTYDVWITSVRWFEFQEIDKLVEKADKLLLKWKTKEAEKLYKQSIDEWIKILKTEFWDNIIDIQPAYWRYGNIEPSISLKLNNVDDSIIDRLVSISNDWFKQKSFYTATEVGNNVKYGIIDEKMWLSIEPWLIIYTKNKITLANLKEIDKHINDVGLFWYTILSNWDGIKIYNLSAFNKDYEWFKKQLIQLAKKVWDDKSIWISRVVKWKSYRIRHLGINRSEWLWLYDDRMRGRGKSSLKEKIVYNGNAKLKWSKKINRSIISKIWNDAHTEKTPIKLTKDESDLYGSQTPSINYSQTVVSYVNWKNNTAPIEETIFFNIDDIFNKTLQPETVDEFWASMLLNSYTIWKPKWELSKVDQLKKIIEEHDNKQWTLNIMLPSKSAYEQIAYLSIDNKKKIEFVYPKDGSSKFYVDNDGIVHLWFSNEKAKADLVNDFNALKIDLWLKPYLLQPSEAIETYTKKWYWDSITTERLVNTFWLYAKPDDVTLQKATLMLRSLSRIDGKYTTDFVDYANEFEKIKLLDIDYLKWEAEDLAWEIIDKEELIVKWQLDSANVWKIQKDYFNYMFANSVDNKIMALYVFLDNFKKKPWDVALNLTKQMYIFNDMLKFGLDVNFDWFWNFIKLLDSNPTEALIMQDDFISRTLGKNQWRFNWAMDFYETIKQWFYVNANERIYSIRDEISDAVKNEIDLPTNWRWLAIIENDVTMPDVTSELYDMVGKYTIYEPWKWFTIAKEWQEWSISDLYAFITDSRVVLDRLFDTYRTMVGDIVANGGDNINNTIRKLHSNFEYKLIELEWNMQWILWWALNKSDSFWRTYHGIWSYIVQNNLDDYFKNLDVKKQQIHDRLDRVASNLDAAQMDDMLFKNWNILKGNTIEPWYNYAYNLSRVSWENAPMDIVRSYDETWLREYIGNLKTKVNDITKWKWILYLMYNAISDTLRAYNFQEAYVLTDTIFWYRLPKALIDINPSITSWKSALPMDVNEDLIKEIYLWITDMYSDWYVYTKSDGTVETLLINWNIDKNLQNIQTIIKDKIQTFVNEKRIDWYTQEKFSEEWLIDSYTDVFMPYSSFVYMPSTVVDEVATKRWIPSPTRDDIKSYMSQYISKDIAELKSIGQYDEVYTNKILENVDNLETIWNTNFWLMYNDIFNSNITDFVMRDARSLLAKKWETTRTLIKLYDQKKQWREMAAALYNIVPKNTQFSIRLSKEKKRFFNLDTDLLYASQDMYRSIMTKSDWELDLWFSKLKDTNTQSVIAYKVAKYYNMYKSILKWIVDENILQALPNTFLSIWRATDWTIDETIDGSLIRRSVMRLADIWDSNAFLWIFSVDWAPKSLISDINYKMFADWTVSVEWDVKKVLAWVANFNAFFKTNLTTEEYEKVFQVMYGWKLVRYKDWFEKLSSYASIIWKIVWPVIKIPTVVGLNIITWFTTWYLQWMIRWKSLMRWIPKSDQNILAELMAKYWLLNEFVDLSEDGMKSLYQEAVKLWWWNVTKGLWRSMEMWSAQKTLSLITTNTNNVMDLVLMGNYKQFSLYNAMQSLDGRRFFSAKKFKEYIETLSDGEVERLMYKIEADANRWFYSIIAAADGFMDKSMPLFTGKNRQWSSYLRWARSNISFLNGRWDGIVRWFAKWFLNNLDIWKYLLKNNFSKDAIDNVVRTVEKTPEYLQRLHTLYGDIMLFAKWLRIQLSEWDDEEITVWDIVTAIWAFSTIWAWFQSSLVWQLIWSPINVVSQAIERERLMEKEWTRKDWDAYNKGKLFFMSAGSTIVNRLFSQLKYLKPYNYMEQQRVLYQQQWYDKWESLAKAALDMLSTSASGMLRYLLVDNYNPDNLSFTIWEEWDVPTLMWWEIDEDKQQAFAEYTISKESLDAPWYFKSLLVWNLVNKQLIRLWKSFLWIWEQRKTQQQIQEIIKDDEVLNDVLNWKTPKFYEADLSSIQDYVFDDSALDPATMADWLVDWKVAKWNWYSDDAIAMMYEAIWKENIQLIRDSIVSEKWSSDVKVAKAIAFQKMRMFVESTDLWETEELVMSMLLQSKIWLDVHSSVPWWKSTQKDKENYWKEQYNRRFPIVMKNNPMIALNYAIKKQSRGLWYDISWLYDESGNLKQEYYENLRWESQLRNAVQSQDYEAIKWLYNPLAQNMSYWWKKIIKDDWTIDQNLLNSKSRWLAYIKATEHKRWEDDTRALYEAIIWPNIETLIDVQMKWWDLWNGAMSEAMKDTIDSLFYIEWWLANYIMNQNSGIGSTQWAKWSWFKATKLALDNLSDQLDKIRWTFKSQVSLPQFKIQWMKLNGSDVKIFKAKPTGWYSAPKTTSPFWNNVYETKQWDIKRTYKSPKEFKFKENK